MTSNLTKLPSSTNLELALLDWLLKVLSAKNNLGVIPSPGLAALCHLPKISEELLVKFKFIISLLVLLKILFPPLNRTVVPKSKFSYLSLIPAAPKYFGKVFPKTTLSEASSLAFVEVSLGFAALNTAYLDCPTIP